MKFFPGKTSLLLLLLFVLIRWVEELIITSNQVFSSVKAVDLNVILPQFQMRGFSVFILCSPLSWDFSWASWDHGRFNLGNWVPKPYITVLLFSKYSHKINMISLRCLCIPSIHTSLHGHFPSPGFFFTWLDSHPMARMALFIFKNGRYHR